MKKKTIKLLPFAFTALAAMLQGCGGESANITPEKYDDSTVNGACSGTQAGCVEFALDYPLQGLNFYCGTDTKQTFITTYDEDDGVATGACKAGQKISFFIQGQENRRVDLGSFSIDKIGYVTATAHSPRMTLLDIAEGIRNTSPTTAADLSNHDIAIRLIQMIQAIGLNTEQLRSETEIFPVLIQDGVRIDLDKLENDITAEKIKTSSDENFEALLIEWLGSQVISKEQAEQVLKALLNISNAAVYQPEFSLLSTDSLDSDITGSQGLVGCSNVNRECSVTDNSLTHLLGHFMLMTDRQGMTFGSGLQWKGKPQTSTENPITTIGGLNAHLIRNSKPVQMTADPQSSWIDPETKSIASNPGFSFWVGNNRNERMTITQGRLFNDYMIAGKELFYKVLTGKSSSYQLNENEKRELGLWQQTDVDNSVNFAGTMDLYKIYPITHLDRRIFKTQANVNAQETYLFPLYANLKFTLSNDSNRTIDLGIVIDENGDIRTNLKPSDSTDNECTAEYDPSTMQTTYSNTEKVQQYRIGTVSRTFVPKNATSNKKTDNTLSVRMILANETLEDLNGALIGMNSTIKTSTDGSSESIVVGGALVDLNTLLNVKVNADGSFNPRPTIRLTDSAGDTVKWANSFASFNQVYSSQNPSDEEAKRLAKLSGGTVTMSLANCYQVKVKS